MLRYVPPFIVHKYGKKALSGDFSAYVVLFDIADFTDSCSRLFSRESEGVEILSRYLDAAFQKPIEALIYHGGFVSGFSGDACTVIMPESSGTEVLAAVYKILAHFRGVSKYEDLDLKIRLSVSYGSVHWQIYENENQHEYLFTGQAFDDIIALQPYKSNLIFSESAAAEIGKDSFTRIEGGYVPLENALWASKAPEHILEYPVISELRKKFCHKRLQNIKLQAEHRQAGYCFISLNAIPRERLKDVIATIDGLAHVNYGMVNKIEKSDKGYIAIVMFGIPHNKGNYYQDMCRFSLELIQQEPKINIGLSIGYVLACYTGSGLAKEYTAFGHPMNLASRLMSEGRPGIIVTDTYLMNHLGTMFYFQYEKAIQLKGIPDPIKCYNLNRPVTHGEMFNQNQFVGRENEIDQIIEAVHDATARTVNKAIYVHGDSGIGKSWLIDTVLERIGNDNYSKYSMKCDHKDSELAGIKQLLGGMMNYNPWVKLEEGKAMFHGLWESRAKGDKEMLRIESIIGSIWGYQWEDSSWSRLSDTEKPKQLKDAFTYLMGFLAKQAPILLIIEDSHWIDPLSLEYLQALGKTDAKPIIIITSCWYMPIGLVDLMIPGFQKLDIALKRMSKMETAAIISQLIHPGQQVPQRTVDFIDSLAQGIPLFIEQLTFDMLEHGKISPQGELLSTYGYTRNLKVMNVIDSRIDNLSDTVKNALFNASVLGQSFYVEVLSKMLDSKLESELEQGTQSRVWGRCKGNDNRNQIQDQQELRYQFNHVMIRNAAYGRMMEHKRHNLHFAAAKAMQIVFDLELDQHAEDIGDHYQLAGMLDSAADMYCRAGDHHKSIHNHSASARCYKKALDVRDSYLASRKKGISSPDTVPTLNNWAEQLVNLGGTQNLQEAELQLKRALDVNDENVRLATLDRAKTLFLKARVMRDSCKFPEAVELMTQALDLRKDSLEPFEPLLGSTHHELGNLYSLKGEKRKAEYHFKQAIRIWGHCGKEESPEMADSLNDLARLYAKKENNEEAEELFLRALALRRKTLGNDHIDLTETLNDYADFLIERDRFPEAEKLLKEALEIRIRILGENNILVAETYHSIGNRYLELDDFSSAQIYIIRSLNIRERYHGTSKYDLAESYQTLGEVYFQKSQYTEALFYTQSALSIRESILDPDHEDIAINLNAVGNVYRVLGYESEAEYCFERADQILEKIYRETPHSDLAESYNNHANHYIELGEYDKAEKLMLKSLKISIKAEGENSLDASQTMNDLARLYVIMARYEESETLFRKALKIRIALKGEESLDACETCNDLAGLYIVAKDKDRFNEAETLLLKALKTRKELYKPDYMHSEIADTMNLLAKLYIEMEEFAQARHYWKRAIAIRSKVMGRTTQEYADSLDVLALLLYEQGRYNQAKDAAREALDIKIKTIGEGHPASADSMNILASICVELDLHGEADELYRKAIAIRQKCLGMEHPDVADLMNALAESLMEQDKLGESETYFDQAINIRKKSIKEDSLDWAESLHDKGLLFIEKGDYVQAEEHLIKSRKIRESIYGYNHSEVAESINDLGFLYLQMGLFDKAETLFVEALRVREKELDESHPEVADTLHNLGVLHVKQGFPEEAEEYLQKALKIREDRLGIDSEDARETRELLTSLSQKQETELLA